VTQVVRNFAFLSIPAPLSVSFRPNPQSGFSRGASFSSFRLRRHPCCGARLACEADFERLRNIKRKLRRTGCPRIRACGVMATPASRREALRAGVLERLAYCTLSGLHPLECGVRAVFSLRSLSFAKGTGYADLSLMRSLR
jgi:hypothetical protein